MLRITLCLFILLLLFTSVSYTQLVFTGTVKDRADSSLIASATILNIQSGDVVVADKLGFFQIRADFEDQIVVTAVGYLPDTFQVQPQWFLRSPVIWLVQQFSALQAITVTDDRYYEDSIAFRRDYEHIFKAKSKRLIERRSVKGEAGFGIRFSPITYFSAKAKARRRQVKQLYYQEQQAYVDYRFSPKAIARYTGLKGKTLQDFLLQYRPSYTFCVKSNDMDMLFYINTSLKEFLAKRQQSVPGG